METRLMEFKDLDIKDIGQEILLVGGVWAGKGNTFVCLYPEFAGQEGNIHVLNLTGDEWKALLRQSDLVETEVLEKAEDGKLYKGVIRKCQRNIEQGVSWNVYRRDGYACRYCGNKEVPLTVDHLVLWEESGPSTEANLVSACRKCNKVRGSIQYADWLKHPYYLDKSKKLTSYERERNEILVATLDDIPRVIKKRKR
jgi:hypothetical protein